MHSKKIFLWVTLFEVLTALIIFATWILVLLSMVGSNISWIKTIRLKDDATMLAKEWMEMIYNLRDGNLEKWLHWYCWEFNNAVAGKCAFNMYQWGSWTNYIIDRSVNDTDDTMYELSTYSSDDETKLYLHTWAFTFSWESWDLTRYNHQSSWWIATPYSRYVTIKHAPEYSTSTDKILQVEVHVIADQWVRSSDVVLESLIGDTR
jgi:hypothetical protein